MTLSEEKSIHDRKLQEVASKASNGAIKRAHKKGLTVTVVEGNRIIEWHPDNTKETVQKIRGRSVKAKTLPLRIKP